MSFANLDPSGEETCQDIIDKGRDVFYQTQQSIIPEDYFVVSSRLVQRLVNVLGDLPFKTSYPLIKILNNLEEVEK
jgi:hypothetical protein